MINSFVYINLFCEYCFYLDQDASHLVILLEVSASRQSELGLGRLGREADYPVTSIKLMARQ